MSRLADRRAETKRARQTSENPEPREATTSAYHFFDVVRLRLTRPLNNSELNSLRDNATDARLDPGHYIRGFIGDVLTVNVPKEPALQFLARLPGAIVNYLEISRDLIVPEGKAQSPTSPMLGDLASGVGICLCQLDNQMDIFGYHLPGLIGVSAAFASVYGAFAKFDADQSDENRKFVREWLLGLKADDRQWARFFKELFTKVFGERHLSAKCIGRSVSLSIALCAALWMYWYVKYGRMLQQNEDIAFAAVFFIVFWTMVAVIADYLSLWKTRILLTRPNLFDNDLTAMAIVVGDAVATIIIFLAFISAASLWPVLFLSTLGAREIIIPQVRDYIYLAFSWPRLEDGERGFERMLFLAPLFTSAWLWVYLIVAYGMRVSSHLPSWLRPLSKVMDFENHPVRTIGYVAATVSAAIVGIITLV